jgi:hypothetical protein
VIFYPKDAKSGRIQKDFTAKLNVVVFAPNRRLFL